MQDACRIKSNYYSVQASPKVHFYWISVHLLENDLFDNMLNEVASVVIQASKYVIIF